MATDKPKLQGYVEQQLYDRFTQWKAERGIEKDSQALNELLRESFGVPSPQVPAPDDAHIRQIVELLVEEKLEQRLSNLPSNPPSDTELLSEIADDYHELEDKFQELESRVSSLENLVPVTGRSPENCHTEDTLPEGNLTSELPASLSGTELAKRLKIDKSLVTKNREKVTFEEWTASKDPEGLVWRYMADTKRYQPVEQG